MAQGVGAAGGSTRASTSSTSQSAQNEAANTLAKATSPHQQVDSTHAESPAAACSPASAIEGVGAAGGSTRASTSGIRLSPQNATANNLAQATSPHQQVDSTHAQSPAAASSPASTVEGVGAAEDKRELGDSERLTGAVSHTQQLDKADIRASIVEEIQRLYSTLFTKLVSFNWGKLYQKTEDLNYSKLESYLFHLPEMINSFQRLLDPIDSQCTSSISSSTDPFPDLIELLFFLGQLNALKKDVREKKTATFFSTLSEDDLNNIQQKLILLNSITQNNIEGLTNQDLCHLLLLNNISFLTENLKRTTVFEIDTADLKKKLEEENKDLGLHDTWQDTFLAFMTQANNTQQKNLEMMGHLKQSETSLSSIENLVLQSSKKIENLHNELKNALLKAEQFERQKKEVENTMTKQEEDPSSHLRQLEDMTLTLNKVLLYVNQSIANSKTKADLTSQIQHLWTEISDITKELSEYSEGLEEIEQTNMSLRDATERLEIRIQQLKKEIEEQQRTIQYLTQQKIKIKSELTKTHDKNEKLTKEYRELGLKYELIRTENNRHLELATVIGKTKVQLPELKHNIIESVAICTEMSQGIADLIQQYEAKFAALQIKDAEIQTLKHVSAKLAAEIQELRSIIEQSENIRTEMRQKLTNLRQQSEAQLTLLQTKDDEIQQKADQLQKLQHIIEQSEVTRTEMIQRLTNLTDELEQKTNACRDQANKNTESIECFTKQKSEYEALLNSLLTDNRIMVETIKNRDSQIVSLNQKNDAQAAEIKKQAAEIEKLRKELAAKDSQQIPLSPHGKHAEVSAENQTLKTEIETLQTENQTLKNLFSELDYIIEELDESHSAFNFRSAEPAEPDYKQKIKRLIEYLELMKQEKEETSEQLKKLTSTIGKLLTENETYKIKSEEMKKSLVAICEKLKEKLGLGVVRTKVLNIAVGHTNPDIESLDLSGLSNEKIAQIISETLDSPSTQRGSVLISDSISETLDSLSQQRGSVLISDSPKLRRFACSIPDSIGPPIITSLPLTMVSPPLTPEAQAAAQAAADLEFVEVSENTDSEKNFKKSNVLT